ncbi:MAG: 3'(2'),5'-bisphosphate nucleotidase [Anaerolineales bacterium]
MVHGMINLTDSRVDFALNAVQTAALLVQEIQDEMVTPALTKADRSPVTVADFAAQAVVGYLLAQRFPEASLVGEEEVGMLRSPENQDTLETITHYVSRVVPGASGENVRSWIDRGSGKVQDRYWTLDPIDGTKGFLRGDQYAIALAFVQEGRVLVGVLGCPNLTLDVGEQRAQEGSLLVAAQGEGSWVTDASTTGGEQRFTPLRVSGETDARRARLLRSFESGHTNIEQIGRFGDVLAIKADPVQMDSQAKYALLAAGKGEIYLRLLSEDRRDYREKVWDQAAGSLLVEEAGGKVTDLDGRRLDFSRGKRLLANRGLCATNGFLHPEALKALREIGA